MANPFEKIRFHFLEAIEFADLDERDRYIEEVCRESPEIRERLQAMILAHQMNEDQSSSNAAEDGLPDDSAFGNNFEVQGVLGEGGFGSVYLAKQKKPLQRLVALKVIKPGMNSDEVIARFRVEQSALAIMNHPGISKVLETGFTIDKRPFFVMEYVEGLPITEYCDQNKLTLDERLVLFSKVCHAIAHAHQKGVIHRDLKPSNILVTNIDGTHTAKVIDFGIAKALTPGLIDDSVQTQQFHLIGSPLYMSPEQAGQREYPIDTRTDVYSMGALLYQLVTGVPTFDPDRLLKQDMLSTLEIIRQETVPSISNRFAKLSEERQSECAAQRRQTLIDHTKVLKGEVSWVVARAIEKKPDDRYQSVAEFDQDIQNFLRHRPLAARPPSKLYLTRKFVQRNSLGVSIATLITLMLVGAVLFSLWQTKRALDAEDLAEKRLELAFKAQIDSLETFRKLLKQREVSREHVYSSEVGLAAGQERDGDIKTAMTHLTNHIPTDNSSESDLRGVEWYFLHQLMNRRNHIVHEVAYGYCFVRYLPNSKWLVLGDYQGGIRLIDAESQKPIRQLLRHTNMINHVDISFDGKWMASVADDGLVNIWDLAGEGLAPVKTFRVDEGHAHRVFFLPDNERVLTSGGELAIKIWEWKSGELLEEIDGVEDNIKGNLALSSDGSFLVAAKRHFSVDYHPLVENQRSPSRFDDHGGGHSRCLAISPNNQLAASGRRDNSVTVWNTSTGEEVYRFEGHRDDVQSLSFHPGGKLLASSDRSGVIHFWNLEKEGQSNSEAIRWPRALMAHSDRVWSIDFSQDGTKLTSASRDGRVKTWERREQKIVSASVKSSAVHAVWLDNCQLLYADMGRLFLWNTETDAKRQIESFQSPISALEASEQGNRFVVGTDDGQVRLFDSVSFKPIDSIDLKVDGKVMGLAFSETNTNLIAITAGDGNAFVYDMTDCSSPLSVRRNSDHVFDDIVFALDDKVALICQQNDVLKWDWEENSLTKYLIGHQNTAECLDVAKDQTTVVSGSDDRTIKVWQCSTKQAERLSTIVGHDYKISAIEVSAKRNSIITGDDNGFLSFSQLNHGRFIMQYDLKRFWPHIANKNETEISAVRFSPDESKILISVSRRGILVFEVMPQRGFAN